MFYEVLAQTISPKGIGLSSSNSQCYLNTLDEIIGGQ